MCKLPFQVAAPILRHQRSSSRYRSLCGGAQSSRLLVVSARFIPPLTALFRSIYFWFKCGKMKVRRRRRRAKERSLSLRQVAPVYVAGPPGGAPLTESEREEGPVSQRHTGGVKRSHLSPHLKYSDSSSGAALISLQSTGEIGESGGGGGEKTTKTRGRAAHLRANRLTFLKRE